MHYWLASPWTVNLLILVPVIVLCWFRISGKLALTNKTLIVATLFGVAFGFVEVSVVIYIRLWLTVRWPYSLSTPDVLFLVPIPWYSQVWFLLLISFLSMLVIVLNRKSNPR